MNSCSDLADKFDELSNSMATEDLFIRATFILDCAGVFTKCTRSAKLAFTSTVVPVPPLEIFVRSAPKCSKGKKRKVVGRDAAYSGDTHLFYMSLIDVSPRAGAVKWVVSLIKCSRAQDLARSGPAAAFWHVHVAALRLQHARLAPGRNPGCSARLHKIEKCMCAAAAAIRAAFCVPPQFPQFNLSFNMENVIVDGGGATGGVFMTANVATTSALSLKVLACMCVVGFAHVVQSCACVRPRMSKPPRHRPCVELRTAHPTLAAHHPTAAERRHPQHGHSIQRRGRRDGLWHAELHGAPPADAFCLCAVPRMRRSLRAPQRRLACMFGSHACLAPMHV